MELLILAIVLVVSLLMIPLGLPGLWIIIASAFVEEAKRRCLACNFKGICDEALAAGNGTAFGAFCPNILFPYARETLDSLVTRGSFPALMLAPVNFDAFQGFKQFAGSKTKLTSIAA